MTRNGRQLARVRAASGHAAAPPSSVMNSRRFMHIEPHRGDFTAFRLGQLRSLCADCHNGLDDANNAPRYPVREDGTPSDPRHPWNAACKKFD
jgi:hypothetical protein